MKRVGGSRGERGGSRPNYLVVCAVMNLPVRLERLLALLDHLDG